MAPGREKNDGLGAFAGEASSSTFLISMVAGAERKIGEVQVEVEERSERPNGLLAYLLSTSYPGSLARETTCLMPRNAKPPPQSLAFAAISIVTSLGQALRVDIGRGRRRTTLSQNT